MIFQSIELFGKVFLNDFKITLRWVLVIFLEFDFLLPFQIIVLRFHSSAFLFLLRFFRCRILYIVSNFRHPRGFFSNGPKKARKKAFREHQNSVKSFILYIALSLWMFFSWLFKKSVSLYCAEKQTESFGNSIPSCCTLTFISTLFVGKNAEVQWFEWLGVFEIKRKKRRSS